MNREDQDRGDQDRGHQDRGKGQDRHRLEALVTLSLMEGLGVPELLDLLREYEDPGEALAAVNGAWLGVEGDGARKAQERAVEEAMRVIAEKGIRVIPIGDPDYPPQLLTLHLPPPLFFARGDVSHLTGRSIAVVGTRAATPYGRRVARWLGGALAGEGIVCVSGMARGIDTEAHRGSLDAGGPTVAVLGTGVDIPYPRQNRFLMDRIIGTGCVVSEFPPGTEATRWNFPRRNRIISGLSSGVVVVEAPDRSGALITASCALEQGKTVFAVPGQIGSRQSRGPLSLLRDGATPVIEARDVLDAMGWLPVRASGHARPASSPPADLSPGAAKLFASIGQEPVHVDEIAVRCGMAASEVLSELLRLEMMGVVEQMPGKYFHLRAM